MWVYLLVMVFSQTRWLKPGINMEKVIETRAQVDLIDSELQQLQRTWEQTW